MSNLWKHGDAMSEENKIKTVMSCSDVARLVGLSRQRFRQLINSGVFPSPMYDVRTRRPFYTQEMAIQCQDVRRTNMGINGQPVLFYARRHSISSPVAKKPRVKTNKPKESQHDDLIEDVRALGMTSANATQVDAALRNLYPKGIAHEEYSEVVRNVFLHLERKDE